MSENQWRIFKAICLLFVSVTASFFLWESAKTVREMRVQIDSVSTEYQKLVEPGMKAEASLASAGIALAQIEAKERNSFDAQSEYYSHLAAHTDKILEDVDTTIIPRFVATLDAGSTALVRAGDDVHSVSVTADSSLARVGPLLEAITVRVDDPALDRIVENADQSMTNLNHMMADGAQVTSDGRKVADHYTAIILTPASKVKAATLFAASIIGRILRLL
jgi:hypothetical protein